MHLLSRLPLRQAADPAEHWRELARLTTDWARTADVDLKASVLLLPFAQLLPAARRGFATVGVWMPRIETASTLARNLGPPVRPQAGELSFVAAVDSLTAAQLLQSRTWGASFARRDPRGFAAAVTQVVQTSHGLARALFARPPDDRNAWVERARERLLPGGDTGAVERMLALLALEWAALAPAPASDRLYALRPSAWMVLQAGGVDPWTRALLAHAADHVPALCIDVDAPAEPGGITVPVGNCPVLAVCEGFEDEAQRSAAQVLEHLRRGEEPVALIAQDRLLVRRVRALLDRQQVPLLDETGWKLSTTRAAAQVMTLLRAARPDAGSDALFDWLKAGRGGVGGVAPIAAVAALEMRCRRSQVRKLASVASMPLEGLAADAWRGASAVLAELAAPRRQTLAIWLQALTRALSADSTLQSLQADDAGRQVLAALRIDGAATDEELAWRAVADGQAMSLADFVAWVDGTFEQTTFLLDGADVATACVVITPLASAMLRPFAAVVFPGADDRHLGAPPAPHPLLGDALARALGLEDLAARRERERLAFEQVLRLPKLTLLRRRLDGADPLNDSPLVERLAMTLARRGESLAPWVDPRAVAIWPVTPILRGAPVAPQLLPQRLSASACEALRACPYRFFAQYLLRLREQDELEGDVEKRDYGTWLHEVLYRFHEERTAPRPATEDEACLADIARALQVLHGLDAAEFLPYSASFAMLVPRYVAWLHGRDAAQTRWQHGEFDVTARPSALEGTALYGRIDRIDRIDEGPSGGDAALELIDYKTGNAEQLKLQVRDPQEDTQLAFYAALMAPAAAGSLRASYLALDGSKRIEAIEHPSVSASAAALVQGLATDLTRLRGGAGLPALGEGPSCSHCEARGLCRRDHWTVPDRATP